MTYPFKTAEQLKEAPYSEISHNMLNPRTRLVYCQFCKYTIHTDLYGARCGQCKSFLITVVPLNNVELAE